MSFFRKAGAGRSPELPLSVMAQSAGARVIAVVGVIVLLWLVVAWAVAQP